MTAAAPEVARPATPRAADPADVKLAEELFLDRSAIESLLYREARCLDDGKLDAWLELYTSDALYWIPSNGDHVDPTRETSIAYDNRQRMEERVWRIQSGAAHAQDPRSRTRRIVGNVEPAEVSAGVVKVSSNFILVELRRAKQTTYAGRYEHHLRRDNGQWKIAFKKVELINNDQPIDNLTFIV